MGYILSQSEGASARIHAERRRESFVLYTDHGQDRIELPWELLPELIQSAQALRPTPPQALMPEIKRYHLGIMGVSGLPYLQEGKAGSVILYADFQSYILGATPGDGALVEALRKVGECYYRNYVDDPGGGVHMREGNRCLYCHAETIGLTYSPVVHGEGCIVAEALAQAGQKRKTEGEQ